LLYALFILIVFYFLFSGWFREDPEPGPGELHFYFYRPSGDYYAWNLWLWSSEDQSHCCSVSPECVEENRAFFRVDCSFFEGVKKIGFLFRKGEWEEKEWEDRFISLNGPHKLYVVEGEGRVRLKAPKLVLPPLKAAFLDSKRLIQLHLPHVLDQEEIQLKDFKVVGRAGNTVPVDSYVIKNSGLEVDLLLAASLTLKDKDLNGYQIHLKGFEPVSLQVRGLLYEPDVFCDEAMGCIVESEKVVFRTFAPTCQQVDVLVYSDEHCEPSCYPMKEKRTGIWECSVERAEVFGKFYKYRVQGTDFPGKPVRDVIDPYSRCHTSCFGMSHIYEDQTPVSEGPKFAREDAVIYEVHIRDFSIASDSGMKYKGKYLSFTEENTHLSTDKQILTGISHLKELGVNTIHLLPVHDFDHDDYTNNYNWGYMPFHYFCPSGWYSSNPKDISRVKEFKKLVDTLHKHGFKVVMDVVFNHTAEGSHMAVNFNGMAPHYYYRRTHDGYYFNGSGCGNEFKTESSMGRKVVIDSLKYWAEEYKVDGFRFDLMGLIDYDTWVELEEQLTRMNPDILLYGEPWAAGGAGVPITGKGAQRGKRISVFSDHFRDAIRGDNSEGGVGFIQAGFDCSRIRHGIVGAIHDFADQPGEVVNYAACHDNYTLTDKLIASTSRDASITDTERLRMEKMTAVLLMLSQGIPFLHAGQEFRRSKNGDHNSYQSPDSVNQIDWNLKLKNWNLFCFYRDLITFRSQHKLFRLRTRDEVESCVEFLDKGFSDGIIMFQIHAKGFYDSFTSVVCCLNATRSTISVPMPSGKWKTVVDGEKVCLKIAELEDVKQSDVTLRPWDCRVFACINSA
jgi:pullulanase